MHNSISESEEEENTHTKHRKLIFSVSDSGIGIKDEDISKLFKFFGKVGDNMDEINPQGIGLGLTICNKILNELGSTLKVKSIYG